jgi:hypothetical protein
MVLVPIETITEPNNLELPADVVQTNQEPVDVVEDEQDNENNNYIGEETLLDSNEGIQFAPGNSIK